MLKVIAFQYIIFTSEEIEVWRDDSLRFFMIMKNMSNEIKGNYLRDKSKALIAAIRLRFDNLFNSFCGEIK